MAMYGWIASTDDIENVIKNPSKLAQLKKFSDASSPDPFKFEVDTVVDTENAQGSFDHQVFIYVFNKESQKVGELSVEISDNETGPLSSHSVLLAACLERLGFVDQEDGHADFNASIETPDPQPEDLDPMLKSARILSATFKKAIHIELDDKFAPPRRNQTQGFGTPEDSRFNYREERAKQRQRIDQTKLELREAYKQIVSEYLNKNESLVSQQSDVRGAFLAILKRESQSIPNNQDQHEFEEYFKGFNIRRILESGILNQRTVLASRSSKVVIAKHIAALDQFLELNKRN